MGKDKKCDNRKLFSYGFQGKQRQSKGQKSSVVAERVGFEPTVQLPVLRFSRPALSSTQPSLREWNQGGVLPSVEALFGDSDSASARGNES